jgi:predicted nucleic acid-binding protein
MAQFHPIGRYQFSPEDRLLFDTNVWIPLFDCRSDAHTREAPNHTKIYQGALKRALDKKSQLYTHPFVVAEFVNRMVRDEHNFRVAFNTADRTFKTWRRSPEYREFAEVVAAQTRDFLKHCTLVQHAFDNTSVERCLLAFEEEARDFNDELLLEVCRSHNLRLVTHDGDFRHADIDILTANPAYLPSSPRL